MKAAVAGHQREIERQANDAKRTAEGLNDLSKTANTNFTKIERELKEQSERATKIRDQIEEQKTKADSAFKTLEGQISDASARVKTLTDIAEYSDVAMLNLRGSPYDSGDIIFQSKLTGLMEGTFSKEGNSLRPSCTPEAQEKLRSAIQQFPRFPFSYYSLAFCLVQEGKPEWVAMAKQGVTILEKTSKVAGHQPAHDEALTNLRALLKKNGL